MFIFHSVLVRIWRKKISTEFRDSSKKRSNFSTFEKPRISRGRSSNTWKQCWSRRKIFRPRGSVTCQRSSRCQFYKTFGFPCFNKNGKINRFTEIRNRLNSGTFFRICIKFSYIYVKNSRIYVKFSHIYIKFPVFT